METLSAFELAIRFVLPHETEYVRGHYGDLSNESWVRTEGDPDDRGGRTRYGIDARSHPGVEIAELTREQAIAIYRQEWRANKLDLLPTKLAIAAFDVLVNGGPAFKWLQEGYNDAHPDRPKLTVDGVIGPKSVEAFKTADQTKIIKFFLEDRDARFAKLAEKPNQKKFLAGWTQRDRDLAKFLS